jgi:toxin secretion/phage lysis holin
MIKMDKLKALFSAAVAGLLAYTRVILIPLTLLIVMMTVDYISGISAAYIRGELSSRTGLKGIVKKLGYIGVVIVAAVMDWVIYSGLRGVGIGIEMSYYLGLIVTIWLIINECISVLENLGEIGVPLPPFLMKAINKLKKHLEDKGGKDDDES